MSGFPYWTTDIGGFDHGDTTSSDFRELIVRWFQYGAFCPLFRLHGIRKGPAWPPGQAGVCGSTPSNELWTFGDNSMTAILQVMRLREQLRPYVMEQFQEAARSGTPVMRPLFFDFWNDTGVQDVDDEFMFGPDYLVAPVLVKGASTRFVYLPPLPVGSVWQNVFTLRIYEANKYGLNISEATPLNGTGFGTFPLYQKIRK